MSFAHMSFISHIKYDFIRNV